MMTPQEIVHELDKHIVGQDKAKRAVAVALRNRWRRQQVAEPLRAEITPKNILMIGPTGVGKTEIARRLARLADAPFIKVEATKFTEVGYVGRDVDTIVRDLVEIAVKQTRERRCARYAARAQDAAEDRILDALAAAGARRRLRRAGQTTRPATTRQKFRKKLREGELDDKEIEIERGPGAQPAMEVMAPPGMEELTQQIQAMFANLGRDRRKRASMRIREALQAAHRRGGRKAGQRRGICKSRALANAENNGIVFIDEIDKIATRGETAGRRRVAPGRAARPAAAGRGHDRQHQVRHGPTDHILFIASGAFHLSQADRT